MIRLLTFSSLYPNSIKPRHGVFVEQRLRHLLESGEVEVRVVAPVPWFPLRNKVFGNYADFASVPKQERLHGISVIHPRYPLIPKISMNYAPWLMCRAMRPVLKKIIDDGYDFDLIDAHYFYPDGVAAMRLGKLLNKPVVCTARGTDISLLPNYAGPRKMVLQTVANINGSITVCQALKNAIIKLGAEADKITVLRNGVDLELFQPLDRTQWRQKLGLNKTTLLSVGNLIPLKGNHIIIPALAQLPDTELLIAGGGPEKQKLRELARKSGVSDRVRFLGTIPQEQLRHYYSAVDALVLASSREGWANVLLEAMACGTPVIATNVWGTPEVVQNQHAGVLMSERSPKGLVTAYHKLFSDYPDRADTRRYAEQFSWDDTTQGQIRLFKEILSTRGVNHA